VDIPILFYEKLEIFDKEVIGKCVYHPDKLSVRIDRNFWVHATKVQKRALVFHELGHCLLDLSHDSRMKDGCPRSIMKGNITVYEDCLDGVNEWQKRVKLMHVKKDRK
jgi:hypothetical protein